MLLDLHKKFDTIFSLASQQTNTQSTIVDELTKQFEVLNIGDQHPRPRRQPEPWTFFQVTPKP